MAFTAKIKVVHTEPDTIGEQTKVRFTANYVDANGNRVNQDWAKATPGFDLTLWLTNEFMSAHPELTPGQDFTLTFEKDS